MGKRIPSRIKINQEWFSVQEGWCKLEFKEFMGPVKYTAKEPYIHMSDFYFVYDMGGSKIGEFNLENGISYNGCVTGLEM
jgi:hypothetical protein